MNWLRLVANINLGYFLFVGVLNMFTPLPIGALYVGLANLIIGLHLTNKSEYSQK